MGDGRIGPVEDSKGEVGACCYREDRYMLVPVLYDHSRKDWCFVDSVVDKDLVVDS